MEVIILLSFEVDSDKLRKESDTDDDVKSKMRSYVSEIIRNAVAETETIVLLASSVGALTDLDGKIRITDSKQVRIIDPDTEG